MELLQPMSFPLAVASSKEQLKKISNIVSKYCGQANAESFLQACDMLDCKTANTILDDTVRELTGYDSISIALSAFADKFPQLQPELSEKVGEKLFEIDKVKAVESYREQILEIMGDVENERK